MDFGLRRIGLALSDEEATLASPLRALTVASVHEAPAAVAAVALEVGAGAIVVGAPVGLEGEEGRIEMRRTLRFAKALRAESGLPVQLADESFTSREAEERTGRDGRSSDRDTLHAAAAAILLQRWLDARGNA